MDPNFLYHADRDLDHIAMKVEAAIERLQMNGGNEDVQQTLRHLDGALNCLNKASQTISPLAEQAKRIIEWEPDPEDFDHDDGCEPSEYIGDEIPF